MRTTSEAVQTPGDKNRTLDRTHHLAGLCEGLWREPSSARTTRPKRLTDCVVNYTTAAVKLVVLFATGKQ